MAISYLVDIYKTKDKNSSLLSFGTFLTLFPHLVAGPIVRYNEIKDEIEERQFNSEMFFEGIWRFCIGLGKKIIIANNIGSIADKIFNLQNSELTFALSWIGIVCYTLQIYFDFSGYSDMAIGLARFFGFHFPENFNLPYLSKNVTEFWQKWHISLSRWFRDYLYIPLGGNRKGRIRTYFNLFIVFFLCGLWHGASWTFVVWGIYHGIILMIERMLKNNYKFEMKGVIGNILTFILIMIGWVFFRSTTISSAFHYLTAMFSFDTKLVSPNSYYTIWYYLSNSSIFYMIIGMLFSVIPFPVFKISIVEKNNFGITFIKGLVSIFLLILVLVCLSENTYNPFIYFRF